MKKEDGQKKEFTAYLDDGSNYRFSLNESATVEDARQYATMWNNLAGKKTRVVRITGGATA